MSGAKHRRPPGPRGLPLVGSVRDLRRDPLAFLQMLSREYGDVASFRIGSRSVYQFTHPDHVRDILVTHNRCFHKTGLVLQARPFLGNGLLTSEGEFHTRQRRMIQPALNPQHVSRYTGIITEYADRMCQSWRSGQQVDVFEQMLEVTLKIIARALFDVDLDAEAREIEEAITIAIRYFDKLLSPKKSILSRLPLPRNRRYWRAQRFLEARIQRMISQRRAGTCAGTDVLSRLVQARDVEGDGGGMDDRQIRDEVLTLLAAGHETIATALTWTWFLLSDHPEVEAALHLELDAVLGSRLPTAEDVPELKYTRMVLAESMRLYPPLWALSRRAVAECEIGGYHIPPGTIVGVSQYVTHRDPRFFDRPDEFRPERWDESTGEKRPRHAYFPFGGGPRLCIGEPMAWMKGVLLIATIAQRWRIRAADGDKESPEPLITLRPRGGLPGVLESRPAAGAGARNYEELVRTP